MLLSLRSLILSLALLFLNHSPLIAADPPAKEPSLVITHAHVFDSDTAKFLADQTILIAGDRILSVSEKPPADLDPGLKTIDATGLFIIPGLIDAHVHLVHILDYTHVTGDEILPLFLAAGVTSVRSTGEEVVAATILKRAADQHPSRFPRIFTCSPLIDRDPPIHRDIGRAVTDPAAVPAFVADMATWQVTTLKIYASCSPDIARAVIKEGHAKGLFVTGHLGSYSAQAAVADGIDGIEHITSIFFFLKAAAKATSPEPLDLSHPDDQQLLRDLATRQVMVDPTLSVFRNMILLPDEDSVRNHPDNALAPQRLRDFWPKYLQQTGVPNGPLENRRREFSKYLQLTLALHRAGVPLLVGTDAPEPQCTPGFSLHQEMEMFVEAGIPPATVLAAATLQNARALKQDQHLGSISLGKFADLVLLSADPLADIRNTRKIQSVIRSGIQLNPADLLKLVPPH